eukprot:5016768-Pleurochrysis_carterae.AAC.1
MYGVTFLALGKFTRVRPTRVRLTWQYAAHGLYATFYTCHGSPHFMNFGFPVVLRTSSLQENHHLAQVPEILIYPRLLPYTIMVAITDLEESNQLAATIPGSNFSGQQLASHSTGLASRSAWLASRSAWLARPSAWLARPSAWLARLSAWLARAFVWLACTSAWLAHASARLARASARLTRAREWICGLPLDSAEAHTQAI